MGIFNRFRSKDKDDKKDLKYTGTFEHLGLNKPFAITHRELMKQIKAKKDAQNMLYFSEWIKEMTNVVGGKDQDYHRDPKNDKKIDVDQNNTQSLYNKGVRLDKRGKPKEAITYYEKVLEIEPHHYLTWNNKGAALIRLNNLNQGLACIEKAIELRPDRYEARVGRIYALFHEGDYQNVFNDLNEIIQIHPNDEATRKFCRSLETYWRK